MTWNIQFQSINFTYRVHEFRKFGEIIPPTSVHHLLFEKYRLDNHFNVALDTNMVKDTNPWRYSVIFRILFFNRRFFHDEIDDVIMKKKKKKIAIFQRFAFNKFTSMNSRNFVLCICVNHDNQCNCRRVSGVCFF